VCVWTQEPSRHSSGRDPANDGVQRCASQSPRAEGGRTGLVISSRRLWTVAPSSSPFTGNAPAPETQSAAMRSAHPARVVERIFLLRTRTALPQLASPSRYEMRHERAPRAPTLTERPIRHFYFRFHLAERRIRLCKNLFKTKSPILGTKYIF